MLTKSKELRPFLSVRWKLFGALFILLSIVFFIFFLVLTKLQTGFYHQSNEVELKKLRQSLNIELNQAAVELESVVSAALLSTQEINSDHSMADIIVDINKRFSSYQGVGLVDAMTIVDSAANTLEQWGTLPEGAQLGLERLFAVGKRQSGFECQAHCFIYTSYPLQTSDQAAVLLVAYARVDQRLSQFFSRRQVAVNILDTTAELFPKNSWETSLKSVAQADFIRPIIEQLTKEQSKLVPDKEYLVGIFGVRYAVSFHLLNSIKQNSSQQSLTWVFVQDVDDRQAGFAGFSQPLIIGLLIGFIVSLCLLFIIVNQFCGRLSRMLAISRAINQEADSEINSEHINFENKNRKILDDELQQYDRHLAKISSQMDALREAESNNAIKLQTMIRELNQTKNFIDRLLNEEKTVIMVQRLGGEIIALNSAGAQLFEVEDFNGLTYSELLCADIESDDGLAALNYLYLGGETLVKAEAKWCNKAGDMYSLLWVHALLSVQGTIDPIILSVCVDITAQRKAEDRLEWLAFNDPSLINYNKQVFLEYLPFAINRSLDRNRILALLYCEVAGLPDKTGLGDSEIRDKVIKDVSVRMSNCLRQYDMLTQLSDDHFVIILEGLVDTIEAQKVVENVIKTYTESIEVGRKEFVLNVTVGVSYAPEHSDSVPQLLRNAELAMCQAKQQGVASVSASDVI